jgi:hypothetical protein
VYCVSRLPITDDASEYVLPGRKKRASPALLSGLLGVVLGEFLFAYAAGMGGTGARRLL